jgi:hypothetical protein
MKLKAISILNSVINKIDATQNIDETDTLIGKHVIIDAEDLDKAVIDIKKVIMMINTKC